MDVTLRDALETTLASDPKLALPGNAAVVSLCRVLADQCDAAGLDVSSRTTAAYLSALKDLHRAMAQDGAKEAAGGNLARLRSVQSGKQQPKSTRRRAS